MNLSRKNTYTYGAILLLICSVLNATTFTVTSTADDGAGSLHQAIADANNNAGTDEINFDIPSADCNGAGVCRITIASATGLPDITDAVIIDATTQPRYGTAPENVCATTGSPSYMRVELSTNDDSDFHISSSGASTIKGFSFGHQNPDDNIGSAISLSSNATHWINCNHIGVNAEGTQRLGLYNGITTGSDNGVIGTNSDGVDDVSERNLILTSNYGISISSRKNYSVSGNYFGLTADGLNALTSPAGPGICIFVDGSSQDNQFGSNLNGINDDIERNIFGGCKIGIHIDILTVLQTINNNVAGNWFGLNINGEHLPMSTGLFLQGTAVLSEATTQITSNWFNGIGTAIQINTTMEFGNGSSDNCFTNNTIAVNHTGTLGQTFINNYWGDVTGPSGIGSGFGDAISNPGSGGISYDPWSLNLPGICDFNTAPSTTNDSYTLNEDGTLIADDVDGNVGDANDDGVLANDTDPESDPLSILNPGTFTATGIGGSITIAADGTFDYTPPADVSGIAGLSFEVTDGFSVVSSSLNIDILPVNDAPSFDLEGDFDATDIVGVGITQIQIGNFAHSVVLGPLDENTQNVQQFDLIVDDSNSILSNISLSNNGTLGMGFTLNFGVALVEATLQDDGGTANGGIDTSAAMEFVVVYFDQIFADGFESTGGFRLFDYLESISIIYPHNNHPIYDFNDDSLHFYGHSLQLNNNYESSKSMLLVQYWLQAVLIREEPFGDYDFDGILNVDDKESFNF